MSLEQLEPIRAALLARRGDLTPPLAERRARFEAQMALIPLPEDISENEVTIAPHLSGRIISLPGSDPAKMILWAHGGAFILGSSVSYRDFAVRLARASGVAVLLPDYRLAPENRFPVARDDVEATLAWLEARGHAPGSIVIGGDSAGANLVLAALQQRLARSAAMPAACYLLSPYLDLTHSGASIGPRANSDPFVDPATMPEVAATYAGDADPADPLLSPLFGTVEGLPPMLVQVGSDEALFEDAARLADRLRIAGNPVIFQEWIGMIHAWPLFAHSVDEGGWAIAQAGAFARRMLGG